jgi:hypothetical protein
MLVYLLYECQGCGRRQWIGPYELLTGEPSLGWLVSCEKRLNRPYEMLYIATSKHAPLSELN